MATVLPRDDEIAATEQAGMDTFETQRRYNLLRRLVPIVLLLATLALPFAITVDALGKTITSTAQNGFVEVATIIAAIALRQRNIRLAALAMLSGVTGVMYLVVINDTWFSSPLTLRAVTEFGLLIFPIIFAGVLSNRTMILGLTVITPLFTILTITLLPHDAALAAALARPDGIAIYTESTAIQIVTGLLVLLTTDTLRRTQRELNTTRQAYIQELELERLKDMFIANVNHELRTPIMSAQGYLLLARELGKRNDLAQQDHMIAQGLATVGEMERLVSSILDVRHIERDVAVTTLSAFTIQAALAEAIETARTAAREEPPRSITLAVEHDLTVIADRDKTRQVAINLISNALKYSSAGTPVTVSVALRSATPHEPVSAVVTVRDQGLGIPPEQQALLFHRFVRLERDIASPVPGTGLGLALCRAFVTAMGGTIWLESAGLPGAGTAFHFTLPLAPVMENSGRFAQAVARHRGIQKGQATV